MKYTILALLLTGMCWGQTRNLPWLGEPEPEPTIHVSRATYELVDSGFGKPVPCNPPLPKDSMLACTENTKMWALKCPDGTLDVLPRISNPAFFDFGKARDRGDKFWCVWIKENND